MPAKCSSRHFVILICCAVLSLPATAQYFGRNKVNYRNFDFQVLQTPRFDIYHYLPDTVRRNHFAQQTEDWYRMHQAVLRDTFKTRNPLLIYNNHADFQQTRAIEGAIGAGTGGVTEGLKNRVIMPFMEANAQTDHVLGHELVHAFQYHLISEKLTLNAIGNIPLWMVEGLAEYMSIGHTDAHTAIWMRAAVAANKLPTLKDLTAKPNEYFPYRWGQAFWAYTTGLYGDTVIQRLFIESARVGYADALRRVLKIDEQTFSVNWKAALRAAYSPYQTPASMTPPGRPLIYKKNAGELNIVPSISPDGKRIAYWTEKNLFSIDLYVADAATGEHSERVTSKSFASHIDEYSSFESAVAWSPDSRQLAFVAFAKGRTRLVIARADRGRIIRQYDVPGVPAISNPTWSPDGKTIVVTGLVNGQSDLYAFELETGAVRRLTSDVYADLMPSFSPDGRFIVFSTDRQSFRSGAIQHVFAHNLSVLDMQTGTTRDLEIFPGADNLNPVFGPDSRTIYFLSNRDGFRNLYSYDRGSGALEQQTALFTGITGITQYAPAIHVSRTTGEVVYTYYTGDEYSIYAAPPSALLHKAVGAGDVSMQAAKLPPFNRVGASLVQQQLQESPFPPVATTSFAAIPFKPKFELDYLGNTGTGMAVGGYSAGLAGGVNGMFSDILGNNQLFGAIALNGELVDIGGQFAYINQKKRFNWGASLSHIPYLTGAERFGTDTLQNGDTALTYSLGLMRTFQDQLSVFASYPFSPIRRVEAGTSFARYYYRIDEYTDYYDRDTRRYLFNTKEKLPAPEGFSLGQAYAAFVGDNANFGVTAPLTGHRFRFEAGQYLGAITLSNFTGDLRKYLRLAPITFATRNMYTGRFGKDASSGRLPPLYIGYPSLVRGYHALRFAEGDRASNDININDLIGSQIYVANAELRLPFTGPERLSVIPSGFFFSDLNLFTDGGIAWGRYDALAGSNGKDRPRPRDSKFIMSSGISLRVNLFGYLILEPFLAVPWQNGGFRNVNFGLNFVPGF